MKKLWIKSTLEALFGIVVYILLKQAFDFTTFQMIALMVTTSFVLYEIMKCMKDVIEEQNDTREN